jgi:hypothetical protein
MAITAAICDPSLVAYSGPVYPHQSQQPWGFNAEAATWGYSTMMSLAADHSL